jgi:hypothetical protein
MSKKTIGAKQALDDIRSGMEDPELMEKYGLTTQGLESLFSKLVSAGLIEQWELDRRMPLAQGTAIIDHDFPAQESSPKSARQASELAGGPSIDTALQKPAAAKINVAEAVSMIRSGTGDSAIMERYKLSSKGLESLFRKLRNAGFITQQELDSRLENLEATVDLRTVVEELGLGQPTHILEPVEVRAPEDMDEEESKEVSKAGVSKPGSQKDKDTSPKQRANVYYESRSSWTDNSALVIALVFLFFPLGLYGLYKNQSLSGVAKTSAGLIWLFLLAGLGLLIPQLLGNADDLVNKLNTDYGAYTHAELRGMFGTTLRIYWTNKTTPEKRDSIIRLINRAKNRLIDSGVKRVEVPNDYGTYTATNLVTGEEIEINERAVKWFIE